MKGNVQGVSSGGLESVAELANKATWDAYDTKTDGIIRASYYVVRAHLINPSPVFLNHIGDFGVLEWLASVEESKGPFNFFYIVTRYESPSKDNNYQTSVTAMELPNYPEAEREKWKRLDGQEILIHWEFLRNIVGMPVQPNFDVVRWYNSIMRRS